MLIAVVSAVVIAVVVSSGRYVEGFMVVSSGLKVVLSAGDPDVGASLSRPPGVVMSTAGSTV